MVNPTSIKNGTPLWCQHVLFSLSLSTSLPLFLSLSHTHFFSLSLSHSLANAIAFIFSTCPPYSFFARFHSTGHAMHVPQASYTLPHCIFNPYVCNFTYHSIICACAVIIAAFSRFSSGATTKFIFSLTLFHHFCFNSPIQWATTHIENNRKRGGFL